MPSRSPRHLMEATSSRPRLAALRRIGWYTDIEKLEIRRYNICPDFIVVYNVSSVLGVCTRRSGPCSLVVAFVGLLGRKG